MKKKKIISLISSIFSSVALCGLFVLSTLDHNKAQETDAVTFEIDNSYFNSSVSYVGNVETNIAIGNPNSPPPTPYYVFEDTNDGSTDIYCTGRSYILRNTVDGNTYYDYSFDVSITMFANSYLDTAFTLLDLDFSGSRDFRIYFSQFSEEYLNVALKINTVYFTPVNDYRYTCTLKFALWDIDSNTLLRYASNTYYINSDYVLPPYASIDDMGVMYQMEYNHVRNSGGDIEYKPDFTLINCYFVDINSDNVSIYDSGYSNGFEDGYNSGYSTGYSVGLQDGYNNGVASQQQAIQDAYNNGYNAGYSSGLTSDATAITIFTGILNVALVPINFFLACFNFEILGINLASFIKSILTVLLVIIVIKMVLGSTNSGE